MIPSKIGCFVANAVLGSYVAFLNVFFVSVGLSKSNAGLISGMTYALPTIVGPIWGYVADRTRKRSLILIILCIGAAIPMFSMPWVAKVIYPMSQYKCSNVTISPASNTTLMDVPAQRPVQIVDQECERLRQNAENNLFWALLAIMLLTSIFLVPLNPYIDAIVMGVVKTDKNKATYGGQRIFGSVGICFVSFAAGAVADVYKQEDMSPYTAVFFFFLPCVLFLIPAGLYMIGQLKPDDEKSEKSDQESVEKQVDAGGEIKASQMKLVLALCCKFEIILFFLTVLISGLANNIFLNFSFLYVTEVMHRSKPEMTLVIIVATISETLMFPMTSKLIKLLGGTSVAMIVGSLAQTIRFLVMSFNIPFEVFLVLQSFSSIGFALSFAAMMEHLHEVTPTPIRMTMSTLMTTLFFIGSNFVANVGGSKVYDLYGGSSLFLGQACLCGGWALLLAVYYGGKKVYPVMKDRLKMLVAIPQD